MTLMDSIKHLKGTEELMNLHQGDCVQLISEDDLFQVIGVDTEQKRCWVRRWPLPPKGSPVFEIPLKQIADPSKPARACPVNRD